MPEMSWLFQNKKATKVIQEKKKITISNTIKLLKLYNSLLQDTLM